MPRYDFKLKAGKHFGPDFSQEPREVLGPDGNVVATKRPTRGYSVGATVQDDDDLVARHGSQKFQLIRDRGPEASEKAKAAKAKGGKDQGVGSVGRIATDPAPAQGATSFPAGQVSTGYQESTSDEEGRTHSGPASPETVEHLQREAENSIQQRQQANEEREAGKNQRRAAKAKSRQTQVEEGEEQGSDAEDEEAAELEGKTVAELRELAENEEIDLEGETKKADIIEKIKQSRASK